MRRQMTDSEGLMWRLDADPSLVSVFANLTVCDREVDLERLRRRMARAVLLVPRLAQRVQTSPVPGVTPTWVDDDRFELTHHVRRVRLAAPGDDAALIELATRLTSEPLDRTRPMWEFIVIDGVSGGRGALLQKMHHTVTDGEGGVRLSMQFLDLERDAPEPPPPTAEQIADAQPPDAPPPSDALAPLRDLAGQAQRAASRAARFAADLAVEPVRIAEEAVFATDQARALVGQLADRERARSPLWTARSTDRQLELLSVPFGPVRAAAKALGVTVNTALLAVVGEAAGDYHTRLGAPVEALRASMAVSTRTRSSGSNAFTLARFDLPTGPMELADRARSIRSITEAARTASAGTSIDVLARATALVPTPLLVQLAKDQAHTVDVATSNVRAADFPCFIAGARITHNHPIGPLLGVAANLTVMSYDGSLDAGLHLDRAAVAEPGLLRERLAAAFDLLTTYAPN